MKSKKVVFFLLYIFILLTYDFAQGNKQEKIKMLWIDSEMGVFDVSDKEKVVSLITKCGEVGINYVAVDVKNYAGLAFYNSKIVPRVTKWDGKDYPADFDLLQTMIEEGHKQKIKVFAALNVFSEGLKKEKIGPAYSHPEWEAVVYDKFEYIVDSKGNKKEIISINNRADRDGLSLFSDGYGERIYKKDSPQNAIDGNVDSNHSVWISDDKTNTHFLEINFPSVINIEKLKLFFVKGFVPRAYKILLMAKGNTIKLIDIKENFFIMPEYEVQDKNYVDTIKIEFTDCGFDNIARIREIKALKTVGNNVLKNVCIGAIIKADSSMDRGDGIFITVKGLKVESFKFEKEVYDDGIIIPQNGFVLIADSTVKDWVKAHLSFNKKVRIITETEFFKESEYPKGTLVYVNPINPEVQKRTLEIIKEIINNYEIDGIVLDRVRYDNFKIDFSDFSRKEFEKWLGKKIERFPEDIYELPNPMVGGEIIKGKYYKEWIEWRAKNIKDFMVEISETVKSSDVTRDLSRRELRHKCRTTSNKKIIFGDYVGGWYPEYWEVGVNWASSKYDPSQDYDWATKTYKNTGYAELLDFLSPGLYYSYLTKKEAKQNETEEYNSIEGGIELLEKIVGDSTNIIVGLYYPNLYDKERFRQAVQMSLNKTDGIMIFSHHYFVKDNKWDVLKYALKEKQNADYHR